MRNRLIVLILGLGFLGWFSLHLIERQFGLGRFAENPQELSLAPGGRAIVGGGRAVLGFVAPKKNEMTVEIGCSGQKVLRDVAQDDVTEEICGVRVRWVGPVDPLNPRFGGAVFEVTWDP